MANLPLTQGKVAIIDDEDFGYLNQWKWRFNQGYAVRTQYLGGGTKNRKNTVLLMHRIITQPGRGLVVDHINHNTLDNRRSNIRVCTPRQNSQNLRKKDCNTSGYVGVSWDRFKNKWAAYARVNGIKKHLGRFDSALEASKVRDSFVAKYHGEFARLNHG